MTDADTLGHYIFLRLDAVNASLLIKKKLVYVLMDTSLKIVIVTGWIVKSID